MPAQIIRKSPTFALAGDLVDPKSAEKHPARTGKPSQPKQLHQMTSPIHGVLILGFNLTHPPACYELFGSTGASLKQRCAHAMAERALPWDYDVKNGKELPPGNRLLRVEHIAFTQKQAAGGKRGWKACGLGCQKGVTKRRRKLTSKEEVSVFWPMLPSSNNMLDTYFWTISHKWVS